MKIHYALYGCAVLTGIVPAYADIASVGYVDSVIVQADWDQSNTEASDYIKNKPEIPTVNDATLTIQRNGTTVDTFTANASVNKSINISVPTSAGDIGAVAVSQVTTDGVLTTNATTGNVEVSSTIAQAKVANLTTDLAAKQDKQIGAAKVGDADSTDKGKAVIVGDDGTMTKSDSALGSAAYTASSDYATSTQGGKADTALQSVTANSNAGVVTGIATNGTAITMTKAKIADADVADNAAISTAKSAIPSGWTNTETASALAGGDTVSAALGKLEKSILPVGTAANTVAAGNDARFDSVATSQPSGTPPTGRVWMWFDDSSGE